MNQPNENNAFKKIIPKEKLTASDKKAVLKTIETAKLFIEAFDLLSAKHVETRIKLITSMGGANEDNN